MEITEQEAVTEQKTSEENMIVQSPGPEIQPTLTQKQTKPETKGNKLSLYLVLVLISFQLK